MQEYAYHKKEINNMNKQSFGGITKKEVVVFQTQIMMGSQFGRIKKAQNIEDIIIACLRIGWNDAFRHTSENKKKEGYSILEEEEKKWRKQKNGKEKLHEEEYDDFICGNIINEIVDVFVYYACSTSTDGKIKVVGQGFERLTEIFSKYKETEGKYQLCFGHFQKMFNMALKLYVCLYLCRDDLGISENLFAQHIINNIQNADCPIDSIILDKLSEETTNKEYILEHKWSKYGTKSYPVEKYKKVQKTISELESVQGKSNLYYDFIAWRQ